MLSSTGTLLQLDFFGPCVSSFVTSFSFYGGNLIFRGRFNATGEETAVNLTVQYGFAGGYSAWLNGIFLGSSQGNSTVSLSTDVWTFPDGALVAGAENVVVVIQGQFACSFAKLLLAE